VVDGDDAWSGWELPDTLPQLRPAIWQRLKPRLQNALPSNEQLEHWKDRLFSVCFGAIMVSADRLSFSLNLQQHLARQLLDQLQILADVSRDTTQVRAVKMEDTPELDIRQPSRHNVQKYMCPLVVSCAQCRSVVDE